MSSGEEMSPKGMLPVNMLSASTLDEFSVKIRRKVSLHASQIFQLGQIRQTSVELIALQVSKEKSVLKSFDLISTDQ